MTDTVPVTDVEPPREGLLVVAGGAVELWVAGTMVLLRRPSGREYRQLRSALQATIDDINDRLVPEVLAVRDEILAAVQARVAADGLAEMTVEEKIRDRDEGRRITDERERVAGLWWLNMIAVLAVTESVFVFDDLPPWMYDVEQVELLLGHWQSVPFLSPVP